MIFFTFPQYEYIGNMLRKSPGSKKGAFAIKRYPNGEMHVTLGTDVRGQECTILGAITPPDEQLLSFLFLADTLKQQGARRVTALIPYLAYARHDKILAKESLGTAWVGGLLERSRIDSITTLSLHSDEDREYIPLPINSISLSEIFTHIITERSLVDSTIVAPDEGAIDRCKAVKHTADIQVPIAYFKKRHTKTGTTLSPIVGTVTSSAIIIDDMIDTGQTLIACCKKLKSLGVTRITIMVTHGLFTGDRWQQLFNLGVERIYCTDSIPPASLPKHPRITIIPIAPLLQPERSI